MKKYAINPNRCDKSPGCAVRKECPNRAIQEMDGVYYVNMDVCRGCGVCVKVCPRNAVEESES